MSPSEQAQFLAATQRLLTLQPQVKSVGEAAVLEASVVKAEEPREARAYSRALSSHYDMLSRLHAELAELTTRMAAALDSQCEDE